MAGFSVGGLATGLDTKSMISQLVAVERMAQAGPKKRKAEADARAKAINDLINLMKEVHEAAEGVDTVTEAAAISATSGDEDIFTVTGDGTAAAANYDISILQLAEAQKDTITLGDSLTDSVSQGTYTITVEGETKVDITIDGDNNTVAGLVTAINSSDANVTAATVFDGTNYTLMLTADDTGKSVTYAASNGGSWDGFGINANTLDTYNSAQDAMFAIDGVPITSDTNEVTDALEGLTINLKSASETGAEGNTVSTSLSVAADTDGTITNVKVLTDIINKVLGNINSNTKSSEDSAAVLAFDSTARMLKNSISQALVSPVSGATGDYTSLTMIGIGVDRYGALSFDEDEFKAALAADKEGVMNLITDADDGLAARFKEMADDYTLSEGFLTIRKTMYSSRSKSIADTIERMDKRVDAYEARLKHQFAMLEQMVSGLNQQSSALAGMR